MGKTVIVFYSFHGNVRAVARRIGELIGAELVDLEIPRAGRLKGFAMYFVLGFMASTGRKPKIIGGDVDISGYETLIIGSPVWAGTFSPALKTFFRGRPVTASKVGAFFCHKGGKGNASKNLDKYLGLNGRLVSVNGIEPEVHGKVEELAEGLIEAMNLERIKA